MPENQDDIDLDGWDLNDAAVLNRVDTASALITRGDDVNASGTFRAYGTTKKDGWTPLHNAASRNSVEVASLLIEKGAKVDARTMYRETPLHYATRGESFEVAKLLVDHGADVNAWNHLGWTPLDHVIFFAFEKNLGQYMAPYPPPEPAVYPRLNAVSRLLGKSLGQLARPLAKSSDQCKSTNPTPDPVVPARLLALTRLLIEHGADTDGIDLSWMDNQEDANLINRERSRYRRDRSLAGWTTRKMPENKHDIDLDGWNLFRAAEENRVDITRALIEWGGDVNATDGYALTPYGLGLTPLDVAVQKNSLNMARLLIEHGAKVDAKGHAGATPLHSAANRNSLNMARLLIEHGAKVDPRSDNGTTPLHSASNGVARLLIEKGAEVEARDYFRRTPLGSAVSRNSLNKARLLIKHGANVNARNKNGRTVLHVAAKLDSVDVARLLIEKGAWRNVRSKLGDTPLHQAALKNSLNVARLLIEHGAKIDTKSKADFLPPPPRLDIVVFWKPATLDVAVTPLWWAARCNHLEVTRLLIKHGANTDGIYLNWMDDQEDASAS